MSDSVGILIDEIVEEYKLTEVARQAIFQLIQLMHDDGAFSKDAIYHYITPVIEAIRSEYKNKQGDNE